MRTFIDRKLLFYLGAFYIIPVLIDFGRKAYWKSNNMYEYQYQSWLDLVVHNIFIDWIVVIIFMSLAAYMTKKMFENNITWKVILAIHLFLSFFIGYLIFFISILIVYLFDNDFGIGLVIKNMSLDHFISLALMNFLVYFSMIGIATVYYYIKKVKNIELQKSKLQSQLATTKLNVLKSQIHPHFMFNTLNSISSLIEIDKEKSQNLIADFGDLFRSVLEFNEDTLITLKKELILLDKYIDIVSVRFSDHLEINTNVFIKNLNVQIPSMLIQPIIENAIKYGYSYSKTELKIDISISIDNKYLCVEVENNGEAIDSDFHELLNKGTGLQNIYERLKTLYIDNFEFKFENKIDLTGVVAFIKIPATLSTINKP